MHAAAVLARRCESTAHKDLRHDVKAMLAAAPDAGVFYVCSPNNPLAL